MDVQQARRRFVLPVRIDRSRGENNRQYAVRLFRSAATGLAIGATAMVLQS